MTPGERGAVQRIIREAKAIGFLVYSVFDGEEHQRAAGWTKDNKIPMTEPEVLAAVDSVDDSNILFKHADGRAAAAYLVLGNAADGSELPSDHSAKYEDFVKAMDRAAKL